MTSSTHTDVSRRTYAKYSLATGLALGGLSAAPSMAAAGDSASPRTLLDLYGVKRVPADWSKAALLVIDPQLEYLNGKVPLAGIDQAVASCLQVQGIARSANAPLIHVLHHGKPGGGLFDPLEDGSKFIPALRPREGELVMTKGLPNAFAGTNLQAHLKSLGRAQLVIIGFATHMCVSATARSALDHGLQATVVASACASRDLPDPVNGAVVPAAQTHRSALAALHDRFAVVVPTPSVWSAA